MGVAGKRVQTQGIQRPAPEAQARREKVEQFDSFTRAMTCTGNAISATSCTRGKRISCNIDYYDPTLTTGSEDPRIFRFFQETEDNG